MGKLQASLYWQPQQCSHPQSNYAAGNPCLKSNSACSPNLFVCKLDNLSGRNLDPNNYFIKLDLTSLFGNSGASYLFGDNPTTSIENIIQSFAPQS
ncbi:hypothetical protein GOP47_0003196 [Adiantum capillus-veneris]|uniref:Uncharacterized protein n=1 Tax=Adiantum capillus-veneris TaxID=13818 RepID=A0A9D4ZPW5_ADICA|nr:hypothetical protein GOP47_0003196 [Adiantum capillus-veneris]